jgi:integrase/recombinase XerD
MTSSKSVPVSSWPALDQQLWAAAQLPGGLLTDTGLAMHWRPHTLAAIASGYGHWIRFLQVRGELAAAEMPSARITEGRLLAYVETLSQRVSSITVSSYVRALSEAVRVMVPGVKCELVRRVANRLKRRATPVRDQRHLLVAPSQLMTASICRMKRTRCLAETDPIAARDYGDGLMMAILVSKPVRISNLASMIIGQHINKLAAKNCYEISFEPHETKTAVQIRAELPCGLTGYIDHWFRLLRKHKQDPKCRAMWMTAKGLPMASDGVYVRFCKVTVEELKVRINPHLVRKIVATGIAIGAPELVTMTPSILDHQSDEMEKDVYNLADSLSASELLLKLLESRRQDAIRRQKPKKPD